MVVFLMLQSLLFILLPSAAHAQASNYDWRWVVSSGKLYVHVFKKGEDTPRPRVAEFVLEGSSGDRRNFGPARFFDSQAKDELSISGDTTRQYRVWTRDNAPATGYFVDQNNRTADNIKVSIEKELRYKGYFECTKSFKTNSQLQDCVAKYETDNAPKPDADPEDEGEACYEYDPILGILPRISIKWIVCGVAQIVADAIDGVNQAVENLLIFNPTDTNATVDDDNTTTESIGILKNVWGSILRFANILFVIAFLIMIISTALDLGVVSNYTVKKLLPRIIIAGILANLSGL